MHILGERRRLTALHERGILDTPPEERFDRITRLARRLFDVDVALVNLIDRHRQWTKSSSDGPAACGTEIPRSESFCTTTVDTGETTIVEDARHDPRFRDNPHVHGPTPVRFYAGVPLATPTGHHVGTLCLVHHEPRRFSPADRALLHDLASWVEKELNLDSELDRAAQVQRALLPGSPPVTPYWDITGGCQPSRDVGGDFYDWFSTELGSSVILADVMGKGLPAAIVAATARAALRAAADPSPTTTLDHAANTLADDLAATDTFVTVFAATLHGHGHIRYADAGHGFAGILRADGTTEPLERGRPPIGIASTDPAVHVDHHLTLAPGDLLLIHSDGLLELPFGPRTTAQLLSRLHGHTSADDALSRIAALIGAGAPSDDLTAVIVRRRDPRQR